MDPDEAMRDLSQHIAHLRERQELADEVVDENVVMWTALLQVLRDTGIALPGGLTKMLEVGALLPETCEQSAVAITSALDGVGGYDAGRFRSESAILLNAAHTLDLMALMVEHERDFPS